ncbi:DUF2637 domain-containing protein [Streptomyces cyaneochromogenes]|uniref:DUF2637 domain-containing protein n=1 Tax=Streptomyces cyaneochromogenes TaxID=2496836 RepID=UPI001E44F51D|nr:DUF2637 domain-containing protein [Streptomyces cyaneochromogenes]
MAAPPEMPPPHRAPPARIPRQPDPVTAPAAHTRATRTARLTRAHRVLTAVIITGAVIIAAIGFTGSYTAVRQLAAAKGFGNFSYLFPIGIDAGICVLLALDLLLTWTRIPYPLLRHTAWLLTTATIAFNGAAAWPDPLGVGMHAVIPVLFVVTVEAARHAIGRLADITANSHMEKVRPTRWLLSPIPTFRLWRRMKLWELRSYEQAITLEQQRLIYQARLHTHYGRAWRRKAPVQSLTALRLIRYGIPLAETAPEGLAAAGIEPGPIPSTPHQKLKAAGADTATIPITEATPAPADPSPPTGNDAEPGHAHHSATEVKPPPQDRALPSDPHTTSSHSPPAPPESTPTPRPSQTPSAAGHPQHQPHDNPRSPGQPHQRPTAHGYISTTPADTPHPARQTARTTQSATTTAQAPTPVPTAADNYYLAWHTFQQHHHREPDPTELSAQLAHQGILGRDNQPIKPKALARYFNQFRIYTIWARHRALTDHPSLETVTKELAHHGITGQYNKPLTTADLAQHHHRFQHRWRTLNHHTQSAATPSTPDTPTASPPAPRPQTSDATTPAPAKAR